MADFYIDVENGRSANSGATPALAKQYISEATFNTNVRVFLKRGQVHPIGAYRFLYSGMVISDYGTGAKPILQKTAGSDSWIYLQDIVNARLENFAMDCNGYNGAGITIKPTVSGSSGHVLSNVDVYGSPNRTGFYFEGSLAAPVTNILVENCVSHSNGIHGFQCFNEVRGVLYDSCTAYGNGFSDEAHGFTTYSASASPHVSCITYSNCVAYENIDYTGIEGQGFQFDNNSTDCSWIGCLSYNNEGAGFTFNVGSGHRIIGCIAYGNDGPGLISNTATGSVIAHNTFLGNCRSSPYTSEMAIQLTSTGAVVNNNLLTGSGSLNPTGIYFDAGSAVGSTAATNCIYGFTTAATGITPSGTVTSNPLLGDGYRPLPGSPCIAAGTPTVQLSDFYGKEFKALPSIGAVEAQAARTPATRTVANKRSL